MKSSKADTLSGIGRALMLSPILVFIGFVLFGFGPGSYWDSQNQMELSDMDVTFLIAMFIGSLIIGTPLYLLGLSFFNKAKKLRKSSTNTTSGVILGVEKKNSPIKSKLSRLFPIGVLFYCLGQFWVVPRILSQTDSVLSNPFEIPNIADIAVMAHPLTWFYYLSFIFVPVGLYYLIRNMGIKKNQE
ncbi:MAG: hypothetical protein AAB458_03160 [Patescibacteria group bacterium]